MQWLIFEFFCGIYFLVVHSSKENSENKGSEQKKTLKNSSPFRILKCLKWKKGICYITIHFTRLCWRFACPDLWNFAIDSLSCSKDLLLLLNYWIIELLNYWTIELLNYWTIELLNLVQSKLKTWDLCLYQQPNTYLHGKWGDKTQRKYIVSAQPCIQIHHSFKLRENLAKGRGPKKRII